MSRATAAVRFPDGTVRYGIYDGTSDILQPALFDTADEAWEAWAAYRQGGPSLWREPEGTVEDVVIYSDYGRGWTWPGRAARDAVEGPLDMDDFIDVMSSGVPTWYGTGSR